LVLRAPDKVNPAILLVLRSIAELAAPAETIYVYNTDASLVLDLQQLRDITLEDEELMREVVHALIEDTSQQLKLLDAAIQDQDPERCKRLAHYCKGACANVGANSAAELLRRVEHQAPALEFGDCAASLTALREELDRLRREAESL
jgi:HPt (histidine-containing phosphotransfer) domain-containing protein